MSKEFLDAHPEIKAQLLAQCRQQYLDVRKKQREKLQVKQAKVVKLSKAKEKTKLAR